ASGSLPGSSRRTLGRAPAASSLSASLGERMPLFGEGNENPFATGVADAEPEGAPDAVPEAAASADADAEGAGSADADAEGAASAVALAEAEAAAVVAPTRAGVGAGGPGSSQPAKSDAPASERARVTDLRITRPLLLPRDSGSSPCARSPPRS